MKTKIKIGSVFFLLLLSPWLALARINVQTVVHPKDVEVGEPFVVQIEISSEESVQVEEPRAPEVEGVRLVGTNTAQRLNSSTVQNEKGELQFKTVRTMVYSFNYQPLKNGDFAIPAVDIKINGQVMKTSPAKIKVYAQGAGGRPKPQQAQQRPGRRAFPNDDDTFGDPFEQMQQMEDTFNQLLQRRFGGAVGGFQALPNNIDEKDAFLIVAEVDKTEAFKGEQLTATWYLYTKAGVRDIDTLKYPDLKGFWKEDIELATLLNFQPGELNGKPYNRALLASYALFPIDEGKATIDPYKAKVTVVGGFGKALTTVKSSEPIPILVKPLPPGQPAGFSGAVGEYQVTAQLESRQVVAHQPFTIRVHVEGRGNAKQFELPNPQLPPSAELYDIKKDSKFFKNGMSFKDFEILIIAREAGELVIPPITTSIFNPHSAKYENLTTQEFKINVLPGSGQQGMASARLSGAATGVPEAETLHPLTEWAPKNIQAKPVWPLWAGLYGATAAGILIFAASSLGWFRKPLTIREKYDARLQRLKKVSAQKKWRETGIEATNLSYFVLGEIAGLGGANVQIEKLLEKAPPSVRRDIGADLQKVMSRFYLLGFGPDVAVQTAGNENNVGDDIKKLEKLLSKAIQLSESEGHS